MVKPSFFFSAPDMDPLKGLSAKTVTRLKADWWKDYEAWQKRDLGSRRFLYIWADGVYFKPRMAEEKQCILVIVGADEYVHKELLAMTDGFRESTQSWREVLLDLKRRGLKQDLKLAIGDGALGFRCKGTSDRHRSRATGYLQRQRLGRGMT